MILCLTFSLDLVFNLDHLGAVVVLLNLVLNLRHLVFLLNWINLLSHYFSILGVFEIGLVIVAQIIRSAVICTLVFGIIILACFILFGSTFFGRRINRGDFSLLGRRINNGGFFLLSRRIDNGDFSILDRRINSGDFSLWDRRINKLGSLSFFRRRINRGSLLDRRINNGGFLDRRINNGDFSLLD